MTSTLNFSASTTARFGTRASIIRVRFAGEIFEFSPAKLDIRITSSDSQIRRAVATQLMIPVERLDEHTIDRHPNGSLTLRPDAMFV